MISPTPMPANPLTTRPDQLPPGILDRYVTQEFGARPKQSEARFNLVVVCNNMEYPVPLPKPGEYEVGVLDPFKGKRPSIDLTNYNPDQSVSKQHATLRVASDGVFIVDQDSTQGTDIVRAGRRTKLEPKLEYQLYPDDNIYFGTVHCMFRERTSS